jgi:arylsulfatase
VAGNRHAWWLEFNWIGRRDYVHLYAVDALKATVNQNMNIHWPGPGVNPALAKMFNLY